MSKGFSRLVELSGTESRSCHSRYGPHRSLPVVDATRAGGIER